MDQLERRVGGGEALISELNDWNSCFTFDTVMEASLGTDLKNLEALGEGRPLDPFLPAFRKAFQLNLKFSQGWEMKHYLQPFKNKKLLEEFESSVAVMFDRMDSLIEQVRRRSSPPPLAAFACFFPFVLTLCSFLPPRQGTAPSEIGRASSTLCFSTTALRRMRR